jgi:hypothetical protein
MRRNLFGREGRRVIESCNEHSMILTPSGSMRFRKSARVHSWYSMLASDKYGAASPRPFTSEICLDEKCQPGTTLASTLRFWPKNGYRRGGSGGYSGSRRPPVFLCIDDVFSMYSRGLEFFEAMSQRVSSRLRRP